MDFTIAFIVFPASLVLLVISAHYLLENVGQFGVTLGIRPFVVGAFIVAFGTSLPEASISIFSVLNGSLGIPVAQTVGSNIANILLVFGISCLFARRIIITKNLIDIELPLIVAVTFLFLVVVFDGAVTFFEALFLLAGFVIYVTYIFGSEDNRSYPLTVKEQVLGLSKIPKNVVMFLLTIVGIAIGSHFAIVSTQIIADFFVIPDSIIAVSVLALGTSLPEIIISIQAVLRKEIELLVGNIIGSNIFNILFVVGVPALITPLVVDSLILSIGIPALVGATFFFVIFSISNRVHIWEGLFCVLLYVLLISKLFSIL